MSPRWRGDAAGRAAVSGRRPISMRQNRQNPRERLVAGRRGRAKAVARLPYLFGERDVVLCRIAVRARPGAAGQRLAGFLSKLAHLVGGRSIPLARDTLVGGLKSPLHEVLAPPIPFCRPQAASSGIQSENLIA